MDILSAKEAFDLSTIDRNEETQKEFEKVMAGIAKATTKGAYELRVYHLQEANQQKLKDLGFTITKKTPASKSFSYYDITWEDPDDPFFDSDDKSEQDPNQPTNPDNGNNGENQNPDDPSNGENGENEGNGSPATEEDIDNLFPEGNNE